MITSGFSLAFNGKALLNNSKEMLWNRNIFTVTTSTDGNGTMTASPMSGFSGTTVSLSNTPNAGYNFVNYDLTGATITGNQFIMNNDVTAKVNYYHPYNETGSFVSGKSDIIIVNPYGYDYITKPGYIDGQPVITVPQTGMLLTWNLTGYINHIPGQTNRGNAYMTAGLIIDGVKHTGFTIERIHTDDPSNTASYTGTAIVNSSFSAIVTGYAGPSRTSGCRVGLGGTFRLQEQ